jgi:hypothetical protein
LGCSLSVAFNVPLQNKSDIVSERNDFIKD